MTERVSSEPSLLTPLMTQDIMDKFIMTSSHTCTTQPLIYSESSNMFGFKPIRVQPFVLLFASRLPARMAQPSAYAGHTAITAASHLHGLVIVTPAFISHLLAPPFGICHRGWAFVAWQRRCNTGQSLRALGDQVT
ncbi:unnamed protein product, partial [Ectocarpus sp. 13 AM-2016]